MRTFEPRSKIFYYYYLSQNHSEKITPKNQKKPRHITASNKNNVVILKHCFFLHYIKKQTLKYTRFMPSVK